jgi:zinicin-like metallopeptidase
VTDREAAPAGPGRRRLSRSRERRGRGLRGPLALPSRLAPAGPPILTSRAQHFDDLVLAVVDRIDSHLHGELAEVEFAVEDTPALPETWTGEPVPLAALLPPPPGRSSGTGPGGPAGGRRRIVVFRRPIELRALDSAELASLVREVVVEQVADLLGRAPDDVDPG